MFSGLDCPDLGSIGDWADVILLATPCGLPTVPLLPLLGPELLCSDDWSTQWVADKVGTDGVGKEGSSALWHLGRGVKTRFVRDVEPVFIYGTPLMRRKVLANGMTHGCLTE